jgi:regulator of protease activity HflC (stomatin/prohibitin superfamily)
MAWAIFLVVTIPLLGFMLWLLLSASFVRIEPGKLGLLLVRGRATDHALLPGPHFVPALRRMMVQVYPSNELSYRAGESDNSDAAASELEHSGPPLRVMLGDRATVELGCTVRFRLQPEQLRTIHNRFGPDGLWAAVRDESSRTIRAHLGQPELGIDDLFGPARQSLEADLGAGVAETLMAAGFEMTLFSLGDLDLGRTGEVIQATVRARHDLEREEAEAGARLARARIDAELEPYYASTSTDAALRYREVDVWRELASAQPDFITATGFRPAGRIPTSAAPTSPASAHVPAEPTPSATESTAP